MVDDGSADDELADVLDEFADDLAARRPPHRRTPAAARRRTSPCFLARAPIVLFFDDDDRAAPDYLERHLAAHAAQPDEGVAILGHTDWAPELELTPLMHYVTDVDRLLFAYERLARRPGARLAGVLGGPDLVQAVVAPAPRPARPAARLLDRRRDGLAAGARRAARRLRRLGAQPDGSAHRLRRLLRPHRGQGPRPRRHRRPPPRHRDRRTARSSTSAGSCGRSKRLDRGGACRTRVAELEARSRPTRACCRELHAAYREVFRLLHAKGVAETDDRRARRHGRRRPSPCSPLENADPELVARRHARASSGREPLLSITIPVWSRTPELADMAQRTIERIWEVAQVPTEVVVVDNGSPLELPLAGEGPPLPENRGVSTGWNTGIRLSTAPVSSC